MDKRLITILLAAFGLVGSAKAEDEPTPKAHPLALEGFAFATYDSALDNVVAKHLWLVLRKELDEKLSVFAILAPVGPPNPIHDLELRWKQPLPGIDLLAVGKMNPPFGYELQSYRIDRVPGGFYSAVNSLLVFKDTGLTMTGHEGRLRMTGGVFLGHRLAGNEPRSDRDKLDLYLRGEYQINKALLFGLSRRQGPVPASGLDLEYDRKRWRFGLEAVKSTGQAQAYLLALYRINRRLNVFGRQEWLTTEDQGQLGFDLTVGKDNSLRVVAVKPKSHQSHVLVQYVVRF